MFARPYISATDFSVVPLVPVVTEKYNLQLSYESRQKFQSLDQE